MDHFKMLPADITVDILSRVETETVVECKSVCKTWDQLVTQHLSFNKMHSHHHLNRPSYGKLSFLVFSKFQDSRKDEILKYFEYIESHDQLTPIQTTTRMMKYTPPFEDPLFIGSINGLICIASGLSVVISNPFKKEYVVLPTIKTNTWDGANDRSHDATCGFGYISSTNEYKVVQMLSSDKWGKTEEVHVYTLGSGKGWRNLGMFDFGCSYCYGAEVAFANGALYWLPVYGDKLLTFDLDEEKFPQYHSLPKANWDHTRDMGVLDGFLYYSLNRREEE